MPALDALAAIAQSGGALELVLIAGPDLRGEEGLRLARKQFPGELPTRWVLLDQEGPDLGAALRQEPGAVVLAHGLEYMPVARRRSAEESMNLLRDTLVGLEGIILLWVPRSDLEGFRVRCADLFQFRSALVVLEHEDVPLPRREEALRRYLLALLEEEAAASPWLVEPDVKVQGRRLPFGAWIASLLDEPPPTRPRVLREYPAQHRSRALLRVATDLAPAALRHRGPIPMLIWREREDSRTPLDEDIIDGSIDHFSRYGDREDGRGVVLLIDTLSHHRMSVSSPNIRCTVVAIPYEGGRIDEGMPLPQEPELGDASAPTSATLLPWSREQVARAATALGLKRIADRSADECTAWLGEHCVPPFVLIYLQGTPTSERMGLFDEIARRYIQDLDAAARLSYWKLDSASEHLAMAPVSVVSGQAEDEYAVSHLRHWELLLGDEEMSPFPPGARAGDLDQYDRRFTYLVAQFLRVGMLRQEDFFPYSVRPHFLWSYFAARHLLREGLSALDRVAPHRDEPDWRAVVIMVAARLSRLSANREAMWTGTLWPLLWPDAPAGDDGLRRMALAIEVATEAGLGLAEMQTRMAQAEAALAERSADEGIPSEARDELRDALRRALTE